MTQRSGIGFDVHLLAPNTKLILGGVQIPHHSGLIGHSDGDVLIHSIIDSLLGASGLGDIGQHFPKNHPDLKNIKSTLMLNKTYKLLNNAQWRVINVDATIIAEEPIISPYAESMSKIIAQEISIDSKSVNIKSTTSDKLGFTGRKEGIAAMSIATIQELT